MTVLDDLLAEGHIEMVEADRDVAAKWLADAERHLMAAAQVAAVDPAGAYVLAYDAARKSVAAVLLVTGHRVRSRPGAHQALARFAESLSTQTGEPAFRRLDRLRRNRNRSEYGSRTFSGREVQGAVETASAIRLVCVDLV